MPAAEKQKAASCSQDVKAASYRRISGNDIIIEKWIYLNETQKGCGTPSTIWSIHLNMSSTCATIPKS